MKYRKLGFSIRIILILFIQLIPIYSLAQKNESWNIEFCFDYDQVTNDHKGDLDKVIRLINSKKFNFLRIFGYTDTIGDENYNEMLSKKRTENIFNYISSRGTIDSSNFYYTWLGESPYVYDLHFDKAKPQTRTVDIIVYLK